MNKFQPGDLVRVRNHFFLTEDKVVTVVASNNGIVTVSDGDTIANMWESTECAVDLVKSAESVAESVNSQPSIKFVDGERVRYRGTAYFVENNYEDITPDGDIIIKLAMSSEEGLFVPQNECTAAPLPNIPWEDVEDLVAARFAEFWKTCRDQNITGRLEISLGAEGYLSSNDPEFKATAYLSSAQSIISGRLEKSFDMLIKRYYENEQLKPKLLPKR